MAKKQRVGRPSKVDGDKTQVGFLVEQKHIDALDQMIEDTPLSRSDALRTALVEYLVNHGDEAISNQESLLAS